VGNQNIFIKLYFSQPRWALKNRIKKLKEREEEEEEATAAAADENREPREELIRRKIWAKRKRGQLRKKNKKLLGFNVFYFSLFYFKISSN
jgi:hypothetical protein